MDDPSSIPRAPAPLIEIPEPSTAEVLSLRAFWTFLSNDGADLVEAVRRVASEGGPLAFDPLELLQPPLTTLATAAIMGGQWRELYEHLEQKGARQAKSGLPLALWLPVIRHFKRAALGRVFAVADGAPVEHDVLLGLEAFADLFLWGVGRGFFGKRDHLVRAEEKGRAQESLRKAELEVKKWSFAFEQARAPMCIESVDGEHLAVNRAYADLHGYAADELIRRPVSDLVSEPDRARLARWVGEASASGHVVFEHRRMTRHGVEFSALVDVTAIRNEEGEVEYRFLTVQDLTAVRATEAALRRRADELRSSNEDLLRFAYAASHDLAEPLRGVRGFAQLLEVEYRDKLDANGQRFIGHIVAGAKRMQELITDLLAYSRAGRLEVERTLVETGRLCDEAIARLSSTIEQSSAVVTHDGLPTIAAPRALSHVFFHLLANALKFTGDSPPRIHVSAKERDGAWEFAMQDNGIGIAEEYWERVFNVFERLHSRDEYPGSGIGLAIVKRIVEQTGGRVYMRSLPDEGSTFYFTLPDVTETDGNPAKDA